MPASRSIAWSVLLRQVHLYLGMLIAPSILMFAFSGAIQIFRLHEAHPGYQPPALIERLGRLHKDQVFAVAPPRPPKAPSPQTSSLSALPATIADHDQADGDHEHADAAPTAATDARAARPSPALSKQLLQWFFTVVAVGLIASTLLGVWMGAMQSRWRVSARWVLLAGVILPIALLFV